MKNVVMKVSPSSLYNEKRDIGSVGVTGNLARNRSPGDVTLLPASPSPTMPYAIQLWNSMAEDWWRPKIRAECRLFCEKRICAFYSFVNEWLWLIQCNYDPAIGRQSLWCTSEWYLKRKWLQLSKFSHWEEGRNVVLTWWELTAEWQALPSRCSLVKSV